jgi:hypothetical protein
VSPHINKQTTEVLLNNFQALGSEHIQINGNEMLENFRAFLENHTYMKAIKKFNQGNVKAQDCSKCRFKCNENVSDESRPSIMPFYYALRSYERQRALICDMINIVKRAQSIWKKSVSHQYYLSVDNNRIRVCKNFFMKTIDIERKTMDYTVKRKQHGAFRDTDTRGKQPWENKIEKETIEVVHRHIRSFPKMESHYSRKKKNIALLTI